jgi:hypothetical protein
VTTPVEWRAGTRSSGYGRGERSGAETFQLMYAIVPAAGMLVEVA